MVPQYLVGMIYSALIHSAACEHAARMLAMSSANKNADKDARHAQSGVQPFRARAAITTELLDLDFGQIYFAELKEIRS